MTDAQTDKLFEVKCVRSRTYLYWFFFTDLAAMSGEFNDVLYSSDADVYGAIDAFRLSTYNDLAHWVSQHGSINPAHILREQAKHCADQLKLFAICCIA